MIVKFSFADLFESFMSEIFTESESNIDKITGTVGRGGRNLPLDVMAIQKSLNAARTSFHGKQKLKVDAIMGSSTLEQIRLFQQYLVKVPEPVGRIDVQSATYHRLRAEIEKHKITEAFDHYLMHPGLAVHIERFMYLYQLQFPKEQSSFYLRRILSCLVNDREIVDYRWIAYILSIVEYETLSVWQPVEEIGKGRNKSYGKMYQVLDRKSDKIRKNSYYGRGYIPLRWNYYYTHIGIEIGLGGDLYLYPELALKHEIAYKILSHVMRKGSFTKGKSLTQYFSRTKSDYIGARMILPGSDNSVRIAKKAKIYCDLLLASKV